MSYGLPLVLRHNTLTIMKNIFLGILLLNTALKKYCRITLFPLNKSICSKLPKSMIYHHKQVFRNLKTKYLQNDILSNR